MSVGRDGGGPEAGPAGNAVMRRRGPVSVRPPLRRHHTMGAVGSAIATGPGTVLAVDDSKHPHVQWWVYVVEGRFFEAARVDYRMVWRYIRGRPFTREWRDDGSKIERPLDQETIDRLRVCRPGLFPVFGEDS